MLRLVITGGLLLGFAGAARAQNRSVGDTTPVKVVEQAETAFYARDVQALMSYYASNSESYVLAKGDSAGTGPETKEMMRAGIAAFFKKFPKQHGKVLSSIEHGPYVVREYISEDEGRPPRKALWVYEVRGGKIRRAWHSNETVPYPE
jgi:hypothetical protein